MSDAALDEDYYQRQALASPEPVYKTGLPSPVAAAESAAAMRFRGAMGGAALGDEYPDHEPRLSVPYNRYKELETSDPKLYEAINHVAETERVPPTDLAALVYASSGYKPDSRDGARVGYMGLTQDDARRIDPEGELDINKPVHNLFLGAEKYKQIAARYGMGTASAFAAFHGGADRVDGILARPGDQHAGAAPAGMFDFVNRVVGRGGEGSGSSAAPADEPGAGSDTAPHETKLNPEEESQFQVWKQRYAPNDSGQDYDLRGAFKAGLTPDPQTGHFPDTFKKPNHPTFSNQSIYAQGLPPGAAGEWQGDRYVSPLEVMAREAELARHAPMVSPPPREEELRNPPQLSSSPVMSEATQDVIRGHGELSAPPPFYRRGRTSLEQQPNYALDVNSPRVNDVSGVTEQVHPAPVLPPPPPIPAAPPPIPAAPPLSPPEPQLTGAGGILAPAQVPAEAAPGLPQTVPGAPGQTYAIGGALRGTPGLPEYAGPAAAPTTGSEPVAPVVPVAPAAALTPTETTTTADLNRQELARIQAGQPPAMPGVAGAGMGAGVAAAAGPALAAIGKTGTAEEKRLAGPTADKAAAALAPPGTPAAPTGEPPITRLSGSPGTMSPVGLVRAAATGGPNGVLTYMSRGAPRGMSTGDQWNYVRDMFTQAFMLKGDINGARHAAEYVFEMQHRGSMENLMQAIGVFGDDKDTAAQYLARSHAFVTDGAVMGFQAINNKLYAQKYDEQTHDKIGKPFEVTLPTLKTLAMANSDRSKFFTNMHNEQTANETNRHNLKLEKHQELQLEETSKQRAASLEEKKLEFDIQQERLRDKAEADREALVEAARVRRHERQLDQDQRKHDADLRAADRGAEVKSAHAKNVRDDIDQMYGTGTTAQPGTATDLSGNPYKGAELSKARQLHSAFALYNRDTPAANVAEHVQQAMAGNYRIQLGKDGFAHVVERIDPNKSWEDENNTKSIIGNVPPTVLKNYLPPPGPGTPIGQPAPRAPQR